MLLLVLGFLGGLRSCWREGVDVAREVRRYLELLALRVKAKRFVEKWDKVLYDRVVPSREGFAVESVREDRESH